LAGSVTVSAWPTAQFDADFAAYMMVLFGHIYMYMHAQCMCNNMSCCFCIVTAGAA
jgi:hypothetical protein